MTVAKEDLRKNLVLSVENGTTETGATKYKTKKIQHVSATVTDEDMYNVGKSLSGLQTKPFHAVEVQEIATLVESI